MSSTGLKYKASKEGAAVLKRRVFCAFHPRNKTMAEAVMQDIISACDCTVFYYENGEGPRQPEQLAADLREMALFVFVVSAEFLFTPSFARDVAYNFAVSNIIPALPIMTESGLEEVFNERIGNLQCLRMNTEQYDATSVPYAEKLSNYLSKVLATDTQVQRLRAAFDTSIFLSYRKKDRQYAQKLMEMIHNDECCRGIAIWYDEFLVPGEDFNDGIKEEMENSAAVLLVVTPNIVEKNNYVIMTEYPAAIAMGKSVVSFELLPTDRVELAAAYPGLGEPMPAVDGDTVRSAILNMVKQLGLKPLESSDEKDYLKGMSYLRGIYVEKNTDIGVRMVLGAAEKGVEEAVETVVLMYRTGEGVPLSLNEAARWQRRYIGIKMKAYTKTQADADAEDVARAYFELCGIYEQDRAMQEAIDTYNELIAFCSSEAIRDKAFAKEFCATAWEASAALLMKRGEYACAKNECLALALEIRKAQYEADGAMLARLKLIETYTQIAQCCENCEDVSGVKANAANIKKLTPTPDSITDISADQYEIVRRILACNNKLGHLYVYEDDYNRAFMCIGDSILLAEKLRKISDRHDARRQLMLAYINDGDQHAFKKVENHLRAAEEAYSNARAEATALYAQSEGSLELERDMASIVRKQAHVKKWLGALPESLELYTDALERFRALHDMMGTPPAKKDLYDCMCEAAEVYEQMKDTPACQSLLKESVELAAEACRCSELAVYKRDLAVLLGLVATQYKKQWDMDEALRCRKEKCALLRELWQRTGSVRDVRMLAAALKEAISAAKMAGEFGEGKALAEELARLIEKNKLYFNG